VLAGHAKFVYGNHAFVGLWGGKNVAISIDGGATWELRPSSSPEHTFAIGDTFFGYSGTSFHSSPDGLVWKVLRDLFDTPIVDLTPLRRP
jgi:hypothetical protein